MTIVVTFVGGWGHVEPLLPIAGIARAEGHPVVVAGQRAALPRLRDLGFSTVPVGPDTLTAGRLPLTVIDRDAERAVMRDHFVTRYGTQRARSLGELFDREQPHLVVCDEVDYGSIVAAEQRAIPSVTVSVIAAGRLVSPAVVAGAWSRLRVEHGLAADPLCERLGGCLALAPLPRSFRDPALPCTSNVRWIRPAVLDEATHATKPPRPFVYATLGTVFNVESGDLLERVIDGLAQLDADTLVTIGNNIDRLELGALPPNVRVEAFVPQRHILGRCSAVICHGGSGTLMAALSMGVPVVLLPMGADQPDNADRCEAMGVGIVLDAHIANPGGIAEAIRAVLHQPGFALAAARLAGEAAGQPRAAQTPELLDRIRGA